MRSDRAPALPRVVHARILAVWPSTRTRTTKPEPGSAIRGDPDRVPHSRGHDPVHFFEQVATSPTVRRGGLFRRMAEAHVRARTRHRRSRHGRRRTTIRRSSSSSASVGARSAAANSRLPPGTRPRRAVESRPVDEKLLRTPWFEGLAENLDSVPVADWCSRGTRFLRWRLSRPDAGYVLHVTPTPSRSVSSRTRASMSLRGVAQGVRATGSATAALGGPMVAAACRPMVRRCVCTLVQTPTSGSVAFAHSRRCIPPSPLNLVFKSLDEARAPSATFPARTFDSSNGCLLTAAC